MANEHFTNVICAWQFTCLPFDDTQIIKTQNRTMAGWDLEALRVSDSRIGELLRPKLIYIF